VAGGGGSWKVAYADFVTAMMALFLVLWLVAQDQKVKEAIERSFTNPFMSVTKASVGIIPSKETQAVRSTQGNYDSASAVELAMLRRLNQDLLKSLEQMENPAESPIKLELTSDGLHINVFDRAQRPIFEIDSGELTEYGKWVFSTLSWSISRYPGFAIELEGHTEAGRPPLRPDYTGWELSSDRANTVRRVLISNGVAERQVHKVSGYGDSRPLAATSPRDVANRRVSINLKVRASMDDSSTEGP